MGQPQARTGKPSPMHCPLFTCAGVFPHVPTCSHRASFPKRARQPDDLAPRPPVLSMSPPHHDPPRQVRESVLPSGHRAAQSAPLSKVLLGSRPPRQCCGLMDGQPWWAAFPSTTPHYAPMLVRRKWRPLDSSAQGTPPLRSGYGRASLQQARQPGQEPAGPSTLLPQSEAAPQNGLYFHFPFLS